MLSLTLENKVTILKDKLRISHLIKSIVILAVLASCSTDEQVRTVLPFNEGWDFRLMDTSGQERGHKQKLSLPHDWSITGAFSKDHPAGAGGGALPGGIGWYNKTFSLPEGKGKRVFVQFDGIYQNSTVWINGVELGTRPNGYISFEYELTPYLNFSKDSTNEIRVKVANSQQPNSRWYSGSGIYRNVRLVMTSRTYIPNNGVYVRADAKKGEVFVETELAHSSEAAAGTLLRTEVFDGEGRKVSEDQKELEFQTGSLVRQTLEVKNPLLWSPERPQLYTLVTSIIKRGKQVDQVKTTFGFRTLHFDAQAGFFLNGESVKIKGVCLHHDLGALGAAINLRAIERQLEIMKAMGANAVRTAHNPPAPEVLDLCDQMGLMVMDEMFDMWAKKKTTYDYSQYWEEWHEQDLRDFIKRDRNHPSVIMWSIGNEIIEQYNHEDSAGGMIAKELAGMVRSLDDRPITVASNDTSPDNPLIKYGGLDVLGFNYHHQEYEAVPEKFPGMPFIATETNSELSTRGHYDMPSDSVRIWPLAWDQVFELGNPDHTVSAYDHVRPPWGATHTDTWRLVKSNDFISGMFIWTGFDYLGEPTPYTWPARSSYFGLVDLAGFPKDTYYFYQSEWSKDTVLHVFPHWNWEEGQLVDVVAYYNYADRVELTVNGVSKGEQTKEPGQFHVMWRIPFEPGLIKAVSYKGERIIKEKIIQTAGAPSQLQLTADRRDIKGDGRDLSYITVEVLDEKGTIVPNATNRVEFTVEGSGVLQGVDNGDPVSHASFYAPGRKAFHGKCLAVVRSSKEQGQITLHAFSEGLQGSNITITTN